VESSCGRGARTKADLQRRKVKVGTARRIGEKMAAGSIDMVAADAMGADRR